MNRDNPQPTFLNMDMSEIIKDQQGQTGIIYKCTSPSGKCYIGKHNSNNLEERKKGHKNSYKLFLKKKIILQQEKNKNSTLIPKGHCTALCGAFEKHGFDNFTWEILKKDIPLNSLNVEEDEFIKRHNSMDPKKGYNLKMNNGDTQTSISLETRERMSKSHVDRIDKSRIYQEELKDMPPHITFYRSKKGTLQGYRILNHPNIEYKAFMDHTSTWQSLKEKTLKFLEEYKDKKFKLSTKTKQDSGIPKGIYRDKKGTQYRVQFEYDKQVHEKFFRIGGKKQRSDTEALEEAITWMNDKRKKLKQEKEKRKLLTECSQMIKRLIEYIKGISERLHAIETNP